MNCTSIIVGMNEFTSIRKTSLVLKYFDLVATRIFIIKISSIVTQETLAGKHVMNMSDYLVSNISFQSYQQFLASAVSGPS